MRKISDPRAEEKMGANHMFAILYFLTMKLVWYKDYKCSLLSVHFQFITTDK